MNAATPEMTESKRNRAVVVREYGPFAGGEGVHGVTCDGTNVWFARGKKMLAFHPVTGATVNELDVAAEAGTAFDGEHLYQIAKGVIQKVNPQTGEVKGTIPVPFVGDSSGLAWADGTLWVGQYKGRSLHQIDPSTGKILKTLRSDKFVTGVTFVDGDLWHGTWEGDESDLRRLDPATGRVLESLELPGGISGLEAMGDRFYCGTGPKGTTVRAVKRPSRR
ncbi:MAG TPA: glutamine cyclotransferase [Polyangiaceae bacterium]|jgi:outer membrane protein assembly factor BamB